MSKKLSGRFPNLGMTYRNFNLSSICNIDNKKCLIPNKDFEEIQSKPKSENLISVYQIPSSFAINCARCSRNNKESKIKN